MAEGDCGEDIWEQGEWIYAMYRSGQEEMTDEQVTIAIWASLLGEFLGWPLPRVIKWASRFWDDLTDPDSWFWHETVIYHAVPLLIPQSFRDRMKICSQTMSELLRLEWQIEQAILGEQFQTGKCLMDNYDWLAAKVRVERILRQYGVTLEEARRELESKPD